MKVVSVVVAAAPERVWRIYSKLAWNEWDNDIKEMQVIDGATCDGLIDGKKLFITMMDGKQHTATIKNVQEYQKFSYTAPLPGGVSLVADHELEPMADGGGTRVTHRFGFTGFLGGVYAYLTKNYVQNGLDTNTVLLKKLAESSS
eukprot:m.465286 g.465286  ORF g.465286 m.465286 type:complete len:145 (+) comp21627_c0_seq4:200-634(+)